MSLSQLGPQTVTVQYATNNQTALAQLDYNSKISTLTFQPGETAKTIAIEIKGDTSFARARVCNKLLNI